MDYWIWNEWNEARRNCTIFVCTLRLALAWCLRSRALLRAETHTHVLHFPLSRRTGKQTLIQIVCSKMHIRSKHHWTTAVMTACLQGRWSLACLIWFENKLWEILQLNGNVYLLIYFCSIGARPKFTKRNSMDSVELWKYSSDKVISLSRVYVRLSEEKCACKCNPRISPQKSYKSRSHSMFFYCRMVRTKTLTAYPGEPRVSCHNRAKEKAIPTVSHQMKGRGWTLL